MLFKRLKKVHQGLFVPRTIQIIRDNECACKLRYKALASRRKNKAAPVGQTVKQAARITLTEAELHFLYMATPSDQYGMAVEWEEKMHPPRWLPVPCTVCSPIY
jgi:hypothetical protein